MNKPDNKFVATATANKITKAWIAGEITLDRFLSLTSWLNTSYRKTLESDEVFQDECKDIVCDTKM